MLRNRERDPAQAHNGHCGASVGTARASPACTTIQGRAHGQHRNCTPFQQPCQANVYPDKRKRQWVCAALLCLTTGSLSKSPSAGGKAKVATGIHSHEQTEHESKQTSFRQTEGSCSSASLPESIQDEGVQIPRGAGGVSLPR
jgi:hypothetical protein